MLNVAFSELKMKKGKVVLTNRGSIFENYQSEYKLLYGVMQMKIFKELTGIQWLMAVG